MLNEMDWTAVHGISASPSKNEVGDNILLHGMNFQVSNRASEFRFSTEKDNSVKKWC
jgi:hypothetical protein